MLLHQHIISGLQKKKFVILKLTDKNEYIVYDYTLDVRLSYSSTTLSTFDNSIISAGNKFESFSSTEVDTVIVSFGLTFKKCASQAMTCYKLRVTSYELQPHHDIPSGQTDICSYYSVRCLFFNFCFWNLEQNSSPLH